MFVGGKEGSSMATVLILYYSRSGNTEEMAKVVEEGVKSGGVQVVRKKVNPVRNSSGALNPAGIILKSNPAAEQWGIISNGVNL